MATTYNKLVRDKIFEMLDNKNITHSEHIAGDKEYQEKLFAKLLEETVEVIGAQSDNEKCKEELADLLEVIEAVKELKGFTKEEIEIIRLKKLNERGGFRKRIILEQS